MKSEEARYISIYIEMQSTLLSGGYISCDLGDLVKNHVIIQDPQLINCKHQKEKVCKFCLSVSKNVRKIGQYNFAT